jgi:hypothetical protein
MWRVGRSVVPMVRGHFFEKHTIFTERLTYFTDVEVPPQLNLRRLNIVPMVDNPAVYKFLELKMLECLTLHSDCEENDTSILPTRVIDVGPSDGSRSPFLYIPTKLAQGVQRGKYMALSYVWGPSKTAKTTMATLSTYRDKIPLSELPKTIRDAIFLARKLSIRYLWVDALCIIQSSSARPSTDWELESARMGEIYRKARVTLLASWASHSDDGIFVPSTSIGKACRVIADKASEDFAVIQKGATESDLQFVQTDCLSGRGWALQERYLSTRKAIFSENDVHWECNHDSKLTYDTDWTAIVEDYSKRKLSVSTDKLTALSGLAKALRGPDRGKYLAGLWEEELIPSLLWRMAKCSPRLGSPQVRKYIAPSWSWASVDGEVAFKLGSSTMPGSFQQKITIETNEIQLAGSDEYGQVKNGWLVVCGKIRELQDFDPLMNPSSSPFVITDGRIDSPADCMGSWENKHPHKAGLVWLDGEKTLSGGSKIFGVRYFVLRVAMWRMGAAGHICGLLLKTLPRSPYEYYRVGVFQLSHYAGEDWFSESATRRQIRIY